MSIIYETINLHNKAKGVNPWRYIGSDQNNNPSYFGSSADLKKDILTIGVNHFVKNILEVFGDIPNKELRKIESEKYLKPKKVRSDDSYYNKTDRFAPGCVKGMTWKHKNPRSDEHRAKIVNHRTGSIKSESARQLVRDKRLGTHLSIDTKKLMSGQRVGENNHNSLSWTVTMPTGETLNIVALRAWTRNNNYNFYDVYNSKNGWKTVKHGTGKGGGRHKKEITSGN
jgi:hypothetical protein